MNLNFSYPKKFGGKTYLRFDDTNPEAEKDEYFTSIVDVSYIFIEKCLGNIWELS